MSAHQSIFISYHRSDAGVARQVREYFSTRGVATWMDEFDIPAGAYWPDEIDKGLEDSHTVVGLVSPDSIASRNVKNEWDWALENARPLVLLLLRPCTIPHRYISISWIDATNGDLDSALDALGTATGFRGERAKEFAPHGIPETHYALVDGNSVAYQVFGEGPFDLVLVPGMVTHIEYEWTSSGWDRFMRRLGSLARVINFDKRGIGLSDRIGRVLTMEERMDDIRVVMDAAKSKRAVIFGLAEGGALAALFAATYPERSIALMIYNGLASYVARPDYPWPPAAEEYQRQTDEMAQTLHERWGTEQHAAELMNIYTPSVSGDPVAMKWVATLMRLGASPGAEIARRRMNLEIDVRNILPAISVSTLVMHRTGDRNASVNEGRYIADRIPGSHFVELPGIDHVIHTVGVVGQKPMFDAIETFLHEVIGDQQIEENRDGKLETTLCLLIPFGGPTLDGEQGLAVDSTIAKFGGTIIDRGRHRLLASFDGPVQAIRSAVAIVEDVRASGGEARVGLHSEEIDGGPSGVTVGVAVQLASLARAGDILVSGTVRSISSGSEFEYLDLGEQSLDGSDDAVSIFRISRS